MNAARERILRRVRAALRTPSKVPVSPTAGAIWPPVGDLEARFRAEFAALKGEFVESLAEFVDQPDVGVTECDCLVAATGSVVLTARSGGGRALSVWPSVHVVVARREQIVPDLAAALALLRVKYGRRWPSLVTVISGPSRTSDIEKVLVMGAHGPKRLLVHFLES